MTKHKDMGKEDYTINGFNPVMKFPDYAAECKKNVLRRVLRSMETCNCKGCQIQLKEMKKDL